MKQLAWQLQGTDILSPKEAWDIYDRNWRHLDEKALTVDKQHLIDALNLAFGGSNSHV